MRSGQIADIGPPEMRRGPARPPQDTNDNTTSADANTALTYRQMAKLAGVSVGMIAMALEVRREAPALAQFVMDGTITLPAACRLIRSWRAMTNDEWTSFIDELGTEATT